MGKGILNPTDRTMNALRAGAVAVGTFALLSRGRVAVAIAEEEVVSKGKQRVIPRSLSHDNML